MGPKGLPFSFVNVSFRFRTERKVRTLDPPVASVITVRNARNAQHAFNANIKSRVLCPAFPASTSSRGRTRLSYGPILGVYFLGNAVQRGLERRLPDAQAGI